MKLELDFFSSLCAPSTFSINGVTATTRDFGEHYDSDPENAEDYGCGNMEFTRKPHTQEILEKYRITIPEYELIAGQLEVGLSFGSCGLCA